MTICTHHGDLMRDLARGLLDDERAFEAEILRRDCDHCSAWWDGSFGQADIEAVDSAVGEVFAAFVPPASRRRYGWLAAAAAVVLAIGISSLSLIGGGSGTAVMTSLPEPPAETTLVSLDFEDGTLHGVGVVIQDAEAQQEASEKALFIGDLESGDLSTWTTNG